MTDAHLTHLSASLNPFERDTLCGFVPAAPEEVFGMTSELEYVTCPDCLVKSSDR